MTAVDDAADWRAHGACLSADPDLFFPVSSRGASQRQQEQAKTVCRRCGVRAQCLAFAVMTRQVHGVWGGLGEEELARLRGSLQAPDGHYWAGHEADALHGEDQHDQAAAIVP